ncbi:SpoIIE family protein phosphatase [Aneurinibacillus sp. Ricciae_BoGa-3]|uniref:SpoIIE family protein phosphatase n=1 Tax=Aneurinibacillus sp. Ricciae_BoGa-3 TaxID=3022697 RepID=UPI00233FFFEA|nr:SpoIIE family protein phosphatase [Aneurinibacillus sp. Ricciae_BoGa-3]WCK53696.1 SpoIIE family protein phosphatase [Aneurinibacillus sp. Ricciae_BoGa-3]
MKVENGNTFTYSIHNTSKKPNTLSGDCYFARQHENYMLLSIADGLGSGPAARFAAEKTVKEIEANFDVDSPLQLLELSNRTLQGSRGSVVGIACIDWRSCSCKYAGIGNITCISITPQRKKQYYLSVPGYLNGRSFHAIERSFPFHPGDTIVLYSDGIQLPDNWEYIVTEPGSTQQVLQRIIHQMETINDDATLIIGKWDQTSPSSTSF